jgi:dipeptidyl aminopeptidase/acylaminoacyl peptidase
MPWDESVLEVAPFNPTGLLAGVRLAGAAGVSISQPRFSPEGRLHWLSDESGFWNLYDELDGALAPAPIDFGGADWVFGQSTYAFDPTGTLFAAAEIHGRPRLGRVVEGTFVAEGDERLLVIALCGTAQGLALLSGSATSPVELTTRATGNVRSLRASRSGRLDDEYCSRAEAIDFETGEGATAHALYYPPRNAEFDGPTGELPPLIVQSHGGPTGTATPLFDPRIQFWTTRGFALVDVNYRGSTGYGRAYRAALAGKWGLADVEDCLAAARHLVAEGRVDGDRLLIRGSSAGGFTTLCALTFHDLFRAGASYYGVSDLESLAADTHKFEARYLDALVGPYPAAIERYRERSPLAHAELLRRPVIFLQGLDDRVVPPAQSSAMHAALAAAGVPTAYLSFPGEQHGFRRAENVVRAIEAELYFYRRVLGLAPGDGAPELQIDNVEALGD